MNRHTPPEPGFTLVELLVASVIIILIMAVTLQVTSNTTSIWHRTRTRVDTFQEGRAAFEWMTRQLSQSTLNTYWDYVDASGKARDPGLATFVPKRYARQSDLHFVCGPATDLLKDVNGSSSGPIQTATHAAFFQAPLGLTNANANGAGSATNFLNVSGYFLEFGDDSKFRPRFLQGTGKAPTRLRYRLMAMTPPTEALTVFRDVAQARQNSDLPAMRRWFVDPLNADATATTSSAAGQRVKRVLAENVIALVLLPKRSPNGSTSTSAELAPKYAYDSQQYLASPGDTVAELTRNQLPPLIQTTMVVIDEAGASRLQDRAGKTPPDFGLANLFATSSNGTQYASDLATLEQTLNAMVPRITYRVFSTNVSILQAKWSEK